MSNQTIKEEYIEVNGIKEYTYQVIRENLPVALFVHGSGTPDSLFAYLQAEDYRSLCSCVYYDQRGAGKTYAANKNVTPTYEDMVSDLYETILYVRRSFSTDRVILVANSLGTVLSAPVVLNHPELISGYIVSGFITKMHDCEQIAMEILKKRAPSDKKVLSLSGYPYENFDAKTRNAIGKVRKLQTKYGLSKPISKEMKNMLMKSPIFKPSDLSSMLRSPKINRQLFTEIWSKDAYALGTSYQVPVFFLQGEEDIIAPMSLTKRYYDYIEAPVKKWFPIKNAGHITGFDNTTDYNEAFRNAVLEITL